MENKPQYLQKEPTHRENTWRAKAEKFHEKMSKNLVNSKKQGTLENKSNAGKRGSLKTNLVNSNKQVNAIEEEKGMANDIIVKSFAMHIFLKEQKKQEREMRKETRTLIKFVQCNCNTKWDGRGEEKGKKGHCHVVDKA
eukprot:10524596-Ditylum_brightwellii.AAC.2